MRYFISTVNIKVISKIDQFHPNTKEQLLLKASCFLPVIAMGFDHIVWAILCRVNRNLPIATEEIKNIL